jgi:hypothetical protein
VHSLRFRIPQARSYSSDGTFVAKSTARYTPKTAPVPPEIEVPAEGIVLFTYAPKRLLSFVTIAVSINLAVFVSFAGDALACATLLTLRRAAVQHEA